MPIYEITPDRIQELTATSFGFAGVRERADLQRLLRSQVEIISPETLVIAEEFGEWEDSRRRVDLLGIDKGANLVVIELKRTDDGGHMELQAIRYAAMVSSMKFERAVEIYSEYLQQFESDLDPRSSILDFLEWDEPDEDSFAQTVRIILVSAGFSKEITTSVLWLNDQGLDIRCVRIKPYEYSGKVLADVQQVIPLPEAEEYRVRIKEKQQLERVGRKSTTTLATYDVAINGERWERLPKRKAIFLIVKYLCDRGVTPGEIQKVIPWKQSTMFRSADGVLNSHGFIEAVKAESFRVGKRFKERHYYREDDQLIHSDGRTYAFTNQWGPRCMIAIKNLIEAYPEHSLSCTLASPAASA